MPFDYQAAKAAGYSDTEIDAFLADQPAGAGPSAGKPLQVTVGGQKKAFDQQAALAAGWTQAEINDFLTGLGPKPGEPGNDIRVSDQPETTVGGMLGATARGWSPVAGGAALGAGVGSLLGGVGAFPGALAGAAAGGLATAIGDPLVEGINSAFGTEITKPTEGINNLLTAAGLPVSDTPEERTAEYVGRAAGSVASGLGGANFIAGAAPGAFSPVTQGVAQTLAAQPGLQMAGALTGATAGQSAREAGYGPGWAAAAELGTSLLPGAMVGAGRSAADFFNGDRSALKALEEAGVTPDAFRQTYATLRESLGRLPTMAEAAGQAINARLRPFLASDAASETRVGENILAAKQATLAGTKERAGAVEFAQEAQDAAEQQIRNTIGEGRYAETARTELQQGMRGQLQGVDARGPLTLRQQQKAMDDANYGALREVSTPVDPNDSTRVNSFLRSVNIETRTKNDITKRLNQNKMITGADYEKIRRGLRDRWLGGQIGSETYKADVDKLDEIFGAYLPEVAEAREASFAARSATEGAALGMKAVSAGQTKPATMAEAIQTATPAQRAGMPSGAVQETLNQTSTVDRAFNFATQLTENPDFAVVFTQAMPPALGSSLRDYAIKGKTVIDQLDALGLTNAGGDPAKFRAITQKVLEDKSFVRTLEQRMPKQLVDDLKNYARVQKDFIDKVDALELTNIGKSFSSSYRFAERAELDPSYAKEVSDNLPGGDELLRFAEANKRAVDSLATLMGIPSQKVATMAETVKGITDAALISSGPAGGGFISGWASRFLNRRLDLGEKASRALADKLLDPRQVEPTLKLLEKRGVQREEVAAVMRGALFSSAMTRSTGMEPQE